MAAILGARTKGEWIDRLEQAGVPCAPIHTLPEVLAEPQTIASGMIQSAPGLDLELMGLPLLIDGVRPPIGGPTPGIGEHDRDIRGSARAR
jgi:formyl-CoA transferase